AGVDVAQHHAALGADALLQQHRDITGTASQIEHAVARLHLRGSDEIAFPQPMDAQAHQVIHQVVVVGHGGEHLADKLLLVLGRYVAEAEMGSAGLVGGFAHGGDYRTAAAPRPRRHAEPWPLSWPARIEETA